MPRRRPRFALLLTAILAVAGLALLLSAHRSAGGPPAPHTAPASACVTAHAQVRDVDRSDIHVAARASAPVSVTERATGPKGTATVTRSGMVTARVKASEPVSVTQIAPAAARDCANGTSEAAARTAALRKAYARALAKARAEAPKAAARALRKLVRQQYPKVLARARADAAARASHLAVQARATLSSQAKARARRLVGA